MPKFTPQQLDDFITRRLRNLLHPQRNGRAFSTQQHDSYKYDSNRRY